MKIYVVISKENDECSLNNRAYKEYERAWEHAQQVEKNSGCIMHVFAIELEE